MSRRTTRSIALIYWVAFLVLLSTSVPLALLNGTLTLDSALTLVLLLAFGSVGALVVGGRPENWIGWIFCAGALLWVFGQIGQEYAMYALETRPGALPLGIWAAWLASWTFDIGWFLLLSFTFLLFPTGRLPSPRCSIHCGSAFRTQSTSASSAANTMPPRCWRALAKRCATRPILHS